jgi:hypothetical protein
VEVVAELDLADQLDLLFAKIIKVLQGFALELLEARELVPVVTHGAAT